MHKFNPRTNGEEQLELEVHSLRSLLNETEYKNAEDLFRGGVGLFCIQNMRFRMVWRPKDSNLEFASPLWASGFPNSKAYTGYCFTTLLLPCLHIRNVFEHVTFPHSAAKFTASLRFSLLSREVIIPILIGERKIIKKKRKRKKDIREELLFGIFDDIVDS